MRRPLIKLLALSMIVLAAAGQDVVTQRPPLGPKVPTISSTPASIGLQPSVGELSPATATWLYQKLREYVTQRVAEMPTISELLNEGFGSERDLVESGPKVGDKPIRMIGTGRARLVTEQPALTVDPAIKNSARATLRRRLRREPTQIEIDSELRNFDDTVALLNKDLAAHHDEIAAEMRKTGRFPRELERPILGMPQNDAGVVSGDTRTAVGHVLSQFIEAAHASSQISTPRPGPVAQLSSKSQ